MECFGKKNSVIHKTLLSLSNQQIITGIGILSLGLWDLHNLTLYHFYILWALSILSTITHSSAICALANEFKIDWVVRWIQQFFVLVNFLLFLACTYFLFQAECRVSHQPSLSIDSALKLPLRPFCGQETGKNILNFFKILYIMLAFILHVCCLKISRINLKSYKDHRNSILFCKIFFSVLYIFVAFFVIRSVVTQSYAFGSPSVVFSDTKEKEWDFGQILPVLLLILPLISAIESYRGV